MYPTQAFCGLNCKMVCDSCRLPVCAPRFCFCSVRFPETVKQAQMDIPSRVPGGAGSTHIQWSAKDQLGVPAGPVSKEQALSLCLEASGEIQLGRPVLRYARQTQQSPGSLSEQVFPHPTSGHHVPASQRDTNIDA